MMNGLVVDTSMSNLASTSNNEGNKSLKNNRNEDATHDAVQPPKKKRNLPGNPDPEGEIIALSPRTLMATNRFVCEICHKGFQREQNLQLHRRGHNLPWKLKQRSNKEVIKKKFYVCPEPSCVHHDPSRALGDLTGVKKHYCRKHGEKKWKCEKCSKRYAVQSDWKAHSKVCGTREYRCDCGTVFSRRDSFITHRAFCDALAQESARAVTPNTLLSSQQPGGGGSGTSSTGGLFGFQNQLHSQGLQALQLKREQDFQQSLNLRTEMPPWLINPQTNTDHLSFQTLMQPPPPHHDHHHHHHHNPNNALPVAFPPFPPKASPHMSATALLQKAAEMGVTMSNKNCQTVEASYRPHQAHHMTTAAATDEFNSASSGSGLGLSTREEIGSSGLIHGLASFMNNNNNNKGAGNSSSTVDVVGASSLLSNTMCSFDQRSSAFEGMSFNGMMNNNSKNGDHHHHSNNDGLTRDFLGLTAFPPHRDHFLNMAGLDQIGNSSYNHQQDHDQPTWQS